MRIQNNPTALNAHRNLTNNNSSISKSLEKLSSGYRINRAGDDAAGLAISEKMRAQIKGLETASKNANDGISLIQTAEGALTEVHSMLNRMVELSTQSANGTYTDSDRQKLQDEITALKDEVDRISTGTDFNGIKLLDGTLGASEGVTVGAKTTGTAAAAMTAGDISGTGTAGTSALTGPETEGTVTFTIGATAATNQVYTLAGESFVIQAGNEEADSSLGTVIKLAGTASTDFTAAKVADALANNETFKKAAADAGYDVDTTAGADIKLTEKTASDISVDRL
ncbi:MAG: flagellin, partial [Anaerotignaceae bacterium]